MQAVEQQRLFHSIHSLIEVEIYDLELSEWQINSYRASTPAITELEEKETIHAS